MTYTDFSTHIIDTLKAADASYRFFEHEAVTTWEEIDALHARFGMRGAELKNMLVVDKNGVHFLFVTLAGTRTDMKQLAEIFATSRLSMASSEDVTRIARAVPGCVSPFGFDDAIIIAVDERIFAHEYLLFSAGAPDNTVEVVAADLRRVFEHLPNRVIFVPAAS